MAEPILNEALAEQNLVEPSVKSNVKYELSEELLKELSSNTYSGRVEEDVVSHIAKIIEILDLIKIAVNYDKMCDDDEEGHDPLEFITCRNSKFKDHKKVDETTKRALLHSWIEVGNNEGLMDEDISSDNDRDQTNSSMITKPEIKIGDEFLKILCDNSFNDDLDHRTDYFEFLYWLASKFDNYWELDKNIKSGLWEFYLNGRTNETIDDLVKYNKPCEENSKKTCSDLFFKPYLDAQDGKDIYKIIDRDYSPIPIPAHHDIYNPDELCQIEEFTVIWYSIGSCEEFITEFAIRKIDNMVYSEKDVCSTQTSILEPHQHTFA
ncbi:hypothetical protein Tco_1010622 [Tanacetum coccineum]